MKFFFRQSLFLVAALFLAGCYFENPFTTGPSKDVNTWLLGVWEHTDEKNRVSKVMITPLGADRYTLQVSLPTRKPREFMRYQFEGWISRVGDTNFLTLRCLNSPGEVPIGTYIPAQVQLLDQNNLRLRGLVLDSPTSTSSYNLRKEVRRKLKEGTLYSQESSDWKRVAEVYLSKDGQDPVFTPLRNPTF